MLDKFVDSCGFSWKRTCDAYALLSSACHCEAQSDGAIRFSLRWSMTESSTSGEYEKCDGFPLGKRSCPCRQLHVSACHCEERSDVAIRIPCGSAKRTAVLWANAGKCNEFALSTTDLPGISAGKRIATPVCALVRNDMLKTGRCQRLQGRFPAVHRQCPGIVRTGGKFLHVIARSEATWQSVTPAVAQNEKQYFGRIRKVLRIRLKYY